MSLLTYYKLRYVILRLFAFVDNCDTWTYTRCCTCYRQCHTQVRGVLNTEDIHRSLFYLSLYKWPQSYTHILCKDLRRLQIKIDEVRIKKKIKKNNMSTVKRPRHENFILIRLKFRLNLVKRSLLYILAK